MHNVIWFLGYRGTLILSLENDNIFNIGDNVSYKIPEPIFEELKDFYPYDEIDGEVFWKTFDLNNNRTIWKVRVDFDEEANFNKKEGCCNIGGKQAHDTFYSEK
jgi:hypothetical protein